jgi:polyphosphate kinase
LEDLSLRKSDAFDSVLDVLKDSSKDPDVTSIQLTLYRTNKESPVAQALVSAAQSGKKVSTYVEVRARFDETHNILLSRQFDKSGIETLSGFPNKKVHCKLMLIAGTQRDQPFGIVHIGTGNYNPDTARLYSDISLLTQDPRFVRDATRIFDSLKKGQLPRNLEVFIPAPTQLNKHLLSWIEQEKLNAENGQPSRIIAKVNALADTNLVTALYEASCAGVKVDLIVRGACILRPGIPGLSENIRVRSIVGKYLEHSRIYYFENATDSPRELSRLSLELGRARSLFKLPVC